MAQRVDVGEAAVVGFVFYDENGTLISPSALEIQVRKPDGTVISPTLDETDAEVSIGASLPAALAADLGLSPAENTAGVGIVRVDYLMTEPGLWRFYCLTSDPFIAADSERVAVRPIFSTVGGSIAGNCQDAAVEPADCDAPCEDCERTDYLYQAAWATLIAAGEALTICGLDEPCTRWIEPAVATMAITGPCACEALVVVIRDRRGPLEPVEGEREPRRSVTLDLVLSHAGPAEVDSNGQPTAMPAIGDEAGNNCASVHGLSLRMMREAEAFDRLLAERIRCRLAERCHGVYTRNETWTADGLCRRYTRSIEIRL